MYKCKYFHINLVLAAHTHTHTHGRQLELNKGAKKMNLAILSVILCMYVCMYVCPTQVVCQWKVATYSINCVNERITAAVAHGEEVTWEPY